MNGKVQQPPLGTDSSQAASRAAGRIPWALALAAAVLLVLVSGAVWFWPRPSSSQPGQPVPVPRAAQPGPPSDDVNASSSLQTLTLQAGPLQNAGLMIETVGEELVTGLDGLSAPGVVQPNAYTETPALSFAGGVVRQVHVQAGQRVSAGQTVAVVVSREFAQAQSRYVSLLTVRENARRNLDRTTRLVDINLSGRSEYDHAERVLKTAEAVLEEMTKRFARTAKLAEIGAASTEEREQDATKLRTAEAEATEARHHFERSGELLAINPLSLRENEDALNTLNTAESELASARQELLLFGMTAQRIGALRSADDVTAEAPITASVSGIVTSRSVNPGAVIEANSEIVRVTGLSTVWVVAQLSEAGLAAIPTGSSATITAGAFPGKVFKGRVTYVDSRLDEATRTAQARIEIANPDGMLKFGMYVHAAFGPSAAAPMTRPSVPAGAVQSIGNRAIVFAATDQAHVFELRPVRLGAARQNRHTVLEGLSVGERVVTTGSFMLRAEWLKTQ